MRWIRVLTQMILCRCELSWSCYRRASAALAPWRRHPDRRRDWAPRMAGCINPPYVPAAGASACFLTVACAALSFVDPILGQPKPRNSASRSSAYPKKRRKARSKGQSRVTAIDSSQLALDLAPSVRPGTPVWVPGTQSWRGSSQRSPERASSRTYRAASRKDVVAALDAGTHRAIPKALGSRTKTMLRCWQARRCRCG